MKRRDLRVPIGLVVGGLVVASFIVWRETRPMPRTKHFYLRFEKATSLESVLDELEGRGVVRNPRIWNFFVKRKGVSDTIPPGSYSFRGGDSISTLALSLEKPVVLNVRMPSTNWARRSGRLLEKQEVATADEYVALVNDPKQFRSEVHFELPNTSLEGYLYPTVYPLPPLIGAKAVIDRQLSEFERRVLPVIPKGADLQTIITKASLVELEAGTDPDRAMIAGVIENRLKKKMALQIDASLLYGIQEIRRLKFSDYRNIQSDFNLYRHKGLPPGPICSPSLASIQAVLAPAHHEFLYYVALPDRTSIFAKDYRQHLENIKRRKAAIEERKKQSETRHP